MTNTLDFKKALFQDAWEKKKWAKAILLKLTPPKKKLFCRNQTCSVYLKISNFQRVRLMKQQVVMRLQSLKYEWKLFG